MNLCEICEGEGWVCELHPVSIWDTWHQTVCGAGIPCKCSPVHYDNLSKEERQTLAEYDQRESEISFKRGDES